MLLVNRDVYATFSMHAYEEYIMHSDVSYVIFLRKYFLLKMTFV